MAALSSHLKSHTSCFIHLLGARRFYSGIGLGFQLDGALVYCFSQGFAWLEVGHPFFRDLHRCTTARIAAQSGRAVGDREATKPPNFDALAAYQCITDCIQQGFDSQFCIAVRELTKAGSQFFNEV